MEKRINEVIDSIDRNLGTDVIIRYLIVNLACFFKRDLNFYLRSKDEQARLLNDWHKCDSDGNIICLTLAEFYVDLFKYFNIEARVVKVTNTKIPLYGVMVKGTLCYYFIDTLLDLMPSQYGIFNHIYGRLPNLDTSILHNEFPYLESLTPEYVEFLDNQIDRFKGVMKTDDILHSIMPLLSKTVLRKEFKKDRINLFDLVNYKINFIGEKCINLGKVDGLIERYKMYEYLFRMFFESYEKGFVKIHIFRDYDDHGNPINPELNIIVTDNNKGITAQYVETRKNDTYSLIRKK